MKVSQAFPSKFLKAADLDGRNVLCTMARVEMSTINETEDDKPVLYFNGIEKGLVLNKTNSAKIAMAYGDEMNDWQGQEIVLFPAMVDFKGDTVEAIRVRAAQPKDKQRIASSMMPEQKQKRDPISSGLASFPGDRHYDDDGLEVR